MNRRLKTKWLRALRGNSYLQANGVLANPEGTAFCCLGVLADIQVCTWTEDDTGKGLVPVNGHNRCIVDNADDWLPKRRAGGLGDEVQQKLGADE